MRYLARRIGFYAIAAFFALTLNFVIPRLMPGDPAQLMFGRLSTSGQADPRLLDSLREIFGFVEGPLHEQYFAYLTHMLQGNFGISVSQFPVPVTDVIASSLGWTIRLIGLATILSFIIGTLLGTFAAWRRGRWTDNVVLPALGILNSFPYFWIAMVALYFLAFGQGWFPMSHAYDLDLVKDWGSPEYIASVIYHAMLPAFTIILTSIGGWMLGMRNNMIGILSQDYVVMAQAKGLSDRRVMLVYAARNALLPSLTAFGMSLGFVIGGALLTEYVFSYPGIGLTLLQAVNARDYPLMQGIFLMITFSVLIANLLIDLAYVLLDPRVR
jgi:peptide/nickel transport system permease protein